ncbi:hypothetical protein BC835DRAFT_756427 [Cytidiella melzeri]|nr:hypothetical protein BC835DRAFT_756427 [Cytidiella melzeri]
MFFQVLYPPIVSHSFLFSFRAPSPPSSAFHNSFPLTPAFSTLFLVIIHHPPPIHIHLCRHFFSPILIHSFVHSKPFLVHVPPTRPLPSDTTPHAKPRTFKLQSRQTNTSSPPMPPPSLPSSPLLKLLHPFHLHIFSLPPFHPSVSPYIPRTYQSTSTDATTAISPLPNEHFRVLYITSVLPFATRCKIIK